MEVISDTVCACDKKLELHQEMIVFFLYFYVRVPTRTEKPGKWEGIFQSGGKGQGNFEQTGKVRENHTKYWKTEEFQ